MNYLDILQDSIDYIEDNLKSEISAEELSKKAGFSIFHYYHLFQKGIGIPVNQYILKRKLHSAIYEISLGKKSIHNCSVEAFLSFIKVIFQGPMKISKIS